MGSQQRNDLLNQGYSKFQIQDYVPGNDAVLDRAAKIVPDEFDLQGSVREVASGGKELIGYIGLDDNVFVVYLPPEDLDYGKSTILINGRPIGFTPSQKAAEEEFELWLSSLQ